MLKKLIAASLIASTLAVVGCTSMPSSTQQAKNLELLQNKTWVMTHIGAVEYKTDPRANNIPSIQFDGNEMRVSGADGCNRLMGTYAVKGNQITLGQMGATQMMCMGTMELAGKYTEALNKVASYQVYEKTLKLLDRHGNVVLQYTSAIQPR
ncbi:META domain-containing protein [Acinetobacter sp. ANC 3832]|uniref:META domain-containing protein n=1 Tax=Acinetobacter sp. ANC 3832 TaxID=1977874 RepID=UPI000A334162|nr:META domain-containing protein [Acinetobacter sp. ANC 3832]OTG94293.1 META domain-containing protein [Acinetobacter sp. ANC 3832]